MMILFQKEEKSLQIKEREASNKEKEENERSRAKQSRVEQRRAEQSKAEQSKAEQQRADKNVFLMTRSKKAQKFKTIKGEQVNQLFFFYIRREKRRETFFAFKINNKKVTSLSIN